jgi:hypothetical protein
MFFISFFLTFNEIVLVIFWWNLLKLTIVFFCSASYYTGESPIGVSHHGEIITHKSIDDTNIHFLLNHEIN